MKSTHEGLRITGDHFATVMRHIGAALEHQGVPARERRELLALLEPLRDTIVTDPRARSPDAGR